MNAAFDTASSIRSSTRSSARSSTRFSARFSTHFGPSFRAARSAVRSFALVAPLLTCLAFAQMLLPTSAAAATVQGSGTPTSENRNLAEFQAVTLNGSIDLVVRQGAQSVQVQADDNLLPLLETIVEPGGSGPALVVRWKKGHSVRTRSKVLVTVSSPRLSALASSGSGDIRLETFNTPALKFAMSGSGDVHIDKLSTEDLDIGIAGSSDVVGSGRARRLKVSIAGSGDVRLGELQAEEVNIRIAGSGDAAVHADKALAVSIMGSGDVRYSGNPSLKTSVAGSGSIHRR
ncbi:MAG TPA: head GIN domain-containing protein [Rubrivivax sp.]|nr:head GIN domain-containing protein [Rubrivivax sp.]